MFKYLAVNWISIFALFISSWLLYRDYIQRFRISVRAVGRITASKSPMDPNSDCLHLDLVFNNSGAKRGAVEDVALEIESDSNRYLFRSMFFMRDRVLSLGKELSPPEIETFIGFELGKSESVIKRILFVPHSASSNFAFYESKYHGKVWIKHSKSQRWETATSFEFKIDKEDINEFSKTKRIPQPDGRDYIIWTTRDKPLTSTEEKLFELSEIIKRK